MIENVPGLVSLFKGAIKESIINKFTNMGYTVTYKILCAADYGVPQTRKRVFFVGIKKGGGAFSYPTPVNYTVTTEMALSDLPPLVEVLGDKEQDYKNSPTNEYQTEMRKGSFSVKNHIAAAHSERVKHIISLVPDGGNSNFAHQKRSTDLENTDFMPMKILPLCTFS